MRWGRQALLRTVLHPLELVVVLVMICGIAVVTALPLGVRHEAVLLAERSDTPAR